MLARLEGAYLGVLRIFILIAATVALLVTCLAIVGAAPMIARQLGWIGNTEPVGGSLADFIDEKNIENTASSDGGSDAERSSFADPNIVKASELLAGYVNRHHEAGLHVSEVRALLLEMQAKLPLIHQGAYAESLLRLCEQLVASTGSPLTRERLGELMEWHAQRFQADAAAKDAQAGIAGAGAAWALSLAAGAFLAFIFIVFCFLAVRIERNLRLVHVVNSHPTVEEA